MLDCTSGIKMMKKTKKPLVTRERGRVKHPETPDSYLDNPCS